MAPSLVECRSPCFCGRWVTFERFGDRLVSQLNIVLIRVLQCAHDRGPPHELLLSRFDEIQNQRAFSVFHRRDPSAIPCPPSIAAVRTARHADTRAATFKTLFILDVKPIMTKRSGCSSNPT